MKITDERGSESILCSELEMFDVFEPSVKSLPVHCQDGDAFMVVDVYDDFLTIANLINGAVKKIHFDDIKALSVKKLEAELILRR